MLSTRRTRASVVAALALLCLGATLAASASCPAAPACTLSTDCGSACNATQACLATIVSCQCFGEMANQLVLLIPFDPTKSLALRTTQLEYKEIVSGSDDTASNSWATNDDLKKIAALRLPSSITDVVIRGGTSLVGLNKSVVANVAFDESFLSIQTSLTKIMLENLNLTASMANLAANLPQNLVSMSFQNNLLKEFPASLSAQKDCQYLYLGYNNIAEINPSHEMSALTELALQVNEVSSFTAYFPKLTFLDLANNQLKGVPETISKHESLTTLHLGGNSIPAFVQSHVAQSIKTLTLYRNHMTKFDAILPNLEYLYRGG
uniref:LRRNT domain-containing protein n=1 Tax=Globisporangium ultimum (strain ATCC 200006 / CBS 805.95 / DAOM BR144) TaxID=431595 RepID=K3XAG9_GLOUD